MKKKILIPIIIIVSLALLSLLYFREEFTIFGSQDFNDVVSVSKNTVKIDLTETETFTPSVLEKSGSCVQIGSGRLWKKTDYTDGVTWEEKFTDDIEKCENLGGRIDDQSNVNVFVCYPTDELWERQTGYVEFSPPLNTEIGLIEKLPAQYESGKVCFYPEFTNFDTQYTEIHFVIEAGPSVTTTTTTIATTTTSLVTTTTDTSVTTTSTTIPGDIPPPEPPEILKAIIEAFAKFLNTLKGWFGFSVFGKSETGYAGDTFQGIFTMTNELNYDIPDDNYSDGTRSWSYICHKIYDTDGDVIQEDCDEIILSEGADYDYKVTWNVPSDAYSGKYYVGVMLIEIQKKWDGSQWYEEEPIIIDKEGVEVEISGIPPPEPPSIWNAIKNAFVNFLDWLIFWD